MATRITRADLDAQGVIVAALSRAAGIMADGDRVTVHKGMGGYALMIIPAGETYQTGHPAAGGSYGTIGDTARDAYRTLRAIVDTLSATLDALSVDYVWPAAELAAIRGER